VYSLQHATVVVAMFNSEVERFVLCFLDLVHLGVRGRDVARSIGTS